MIVDAQAIRMLLVYNTFHELQLIEYRHVRQPSCPLSSLPTTTTTTTTALLLKITQALLPTTTPIIVRRRDRRQSASKARFTSSPSTVIPSRSKYECISTNAATQGEELAKDGLHELDDNRSCMHRKASVYQNRSGSKLDFQESLP